MSVATIRLMEPADIPGLVALFRRMQTHYGVPCPPDSAIRDDLVRLPAGTWLLVALAPDGVGPAAKPVGLAAKPVGFAAVSAVYPGPGLRAGLFLKELFVAEEARGAGIGRGLMEAVARFAVARDFARVDWTADRDDGPLVEFYGRTGAAPNPAKLFFRLTGDGLAALAGTDDQP